ncbi:MAG: 30S ribosomal protein S16 [Bdellovibrionaceae bacterium]|nr:30S ribosomal protein S16 [Pseudobdellovibrionaceae bacterium]MBX3034876.1 30S ribosomal protein S16 [Pseudobdellovibrionaceae bacterium]
MAVVIRLARTGAKHEPRYRITVADSRRYATGKFLEVIGHYNPLASGQDKKVVLDMAKYEEWTKKGAQPTDRVKHVAKLAQSSTN